MVVATQSNTPSFMERVSDRFHQTVDRLRGRDGLDAIRSAQARDNGPLSPQHQKEWDARGRQENPRNQVTPADYRAIAAREEARHERFASKAAERGHTSAISHTGPVRDATSAGNWKPGQVINVHREAYSRSEGRGR